MLTLNFMERKIFDYENLKYLTILAVPVFIVPKGEISILEVLKIFESGFYKDVKNGHFYWFVSNFSSVPKFNLPKTEIVYQVEGLYAGIVMIIPLLAFSLFFKNIRIFSILFA